MEHELSCDISVDEGKFGILDTQTVEERVVLLQPAEQTIGREIGLSWPEKHVVKNKRLLRESNYRKCDNSNCRTHDIPAQCFHMVEETHFFLVITFRYLCHEDSKNTGLFVKEILILREGDGLIFLQ